MTHILIMQGTATGGPPPQTLALATLTNASTFGAVLLDYIAVNALALTRVTNAQTFDTIDLELTAVTELTLATTTNANSFDAIDLALLPFVAVNAETTALLVKCTGTYSTSIKIQIDTFISGLKAAGVWSELDWFSCGRFFDNEHDSYLDWTQPTRSLAKIGGITFAPFAGWTGLSSINNARLSSGWNIGDGSISDATHLTMFVKVEAIVSPENGMQPIGIWRMVSGGGPITPDGSFMSLSLISNTGYAGGNLNSGEGNTSIAPGSGVGLWATVRNGATNKTFLDGIELESDAVTTSSGYTHADGISIVGSAGLARRAFNGLQSYAVGAGCLQACSLPQ